MMNDVQAHILISGMVQGVGFRFFTTRTARKMGLTGWVKNRSDGRVEILAEGPKGLIESLIKDLRVGPPSARVQDVQVDWRSFTGGYKTFDVTF